MEMIELDGTAGGGQLLRSALGLSLCTGIAFTMTGIRAGRSRPGLMRQHLTAVKAATMIGSASVDGASIGSTTLRFEPGAIVAGDYTFSTGSAGSTTLVLQTVLPALWNAAAPSRLRLEGGTHNPLAPSADFIADTFLPTLAKMGVQTEFALLTHGFHPAGGGAIVVDVAPCTQLQRIDVTEPRRDHEVSAHVLMSALSTSIGLRELTALSRHFPTLEAHPSHVSNVTPAFGPGNVALLRVAQGGHVEVFDGHGEHRLSAEKVGERLARNAQHYIDSGAAVSANLADQLLVPMALAGGGRFTTSAITDHLASNARLIEKFLPVDIEWEASGANRWMVSVLS